MNIHPYALYNSSCIIIPIHISLVMCEKLFESWVRWSDGVPSNIYEVSWSGAREPLPDLTNRFVAECAQITIHNLRT